MTCAEAKETLLNISIGQCSGCGRPIVLPSLDKDEVTAWVCKYSGCYYVHDALTWTHYCSCEHTTYFQWEEKGWRFWYSCRTRTHQIAYQHHHTLPYDM